MKKLLLLAMVLVLMFTLGGCMFTGTVRFINTLNSVYSCWIDNVFQGDVNSYSTLTIYGVSLGSHDMEADFVSGTNYGPYFWTNYPVTIGDTNPLTLY
jgi:hypothetical protein